MHAIDANSFMLATGVNTAHSTQNDKDSGDDCTTPCFLFPVV